jgi:hypothetical protein
VVPAPNARRIPRVPVVPVAADNITGQRDGGQVRLPWLRGESEFCVALVVHGEGQDPLARDGGGGWRDGHRERLRGAGDSNQGDRDVFRLGHILLVGAIFFGVDRFLDPTDGPFPVARAVEDLLWDIIGGFFLPRWLVKVNAMDGSLYDYLDMALTLEYFSLRRSWVDVVGRVNL